MLSICRHIYNHIYIYVYQEIWNCASYLNMVFRLAIIYANAIRLPQKNGSIEQLPAGQKERVVVAKC